MSSSSTESTSVDFPIGYSKVNEKPLMNAWNNLGCPQLRKDQDPCVSCRVAVHQLVSSKGSNLLDTHSSQKKDDVGSDQVID